MGLGGILVLLLLLVSVIVFIYVIVVTAKGWGILHTMLLCILFIECWVFLVFAAGVHGTRVKFTEQAAKNKKSLDDAVAMQESLLWGELDPSNINLDAVIPVKAELRRMTTDRGRVWRGVTYLQSDGSTFSLELTPAQAAVDELAVDPDAAAAAPAVMSSESLPVDLVVYAFAEELNTDGRPIPIYYLGEYTVASSQDGAVTLKPTLELNADQKQYIATGSAASWTLYELLPQDSHSAFAAPGSQPTDEEIFGRMDEETIAQLMANIPVQDERQQVVIDSYLRDGKRATIDDPADSIWIQVNVLKKFSIDVDSGEVAAVIGKEKEADSGRGYFDSTGRSLDVRLKRSGAESDGNVESGSVQLGPEARNRIVWKQEAAEKYLDNGTFELVQRIYVRPLIDYEQAFNDQSNRSQKVAERIALYQRETDELNKANQLGQEMIGFEQVENQKLSSDYQGYTREISALDGAVQQAQTQLGNLRRELGALYQAIQAVGF